MSSAIGPSLATPRLLTETPSLPSSAATSAPSSWSSLALSQSLNASAFGSDMFGFRAPLNAEDSAIVLAQAALAIDEATKAAKDNRITNAAGGARSSLGAAIASIITANAVLVKAEADKAKADIAVGQKHLERDGLASQAAGFEATIAALNQQLETASEDEAPALRDRIDATQGMLDAKEREIAAVDAQIAPLEAQIADLNGKIPGYRTALQLGSASLLAAYSQVAVQSQGEDLKTIRDFADSVSLDRRLEDLTETLKEFQDKSLARTEDEVRRTDGLQEAAISNRVVQAALGLLAGLSEVVNLLKDLDPTAAVNTREAAISSGQRFQLSL